MFETWSLLGIRGFETVAKELRLGVDTHSFPCQVPLTSSKTESIIQRFTGREKTVPTRAHADKALDSVSPR